jgi:hypothetical protein
VLLGAFFDRKSTILQIENTPKWSGRITTHYSQPELANLIAAANRACSQLGHKIDTMTILKKKTASLQAINS